MEHIQVAGATGEHRGFPAEVSAGFPIPRGRSSCLRGRGSHPPGGGNGRRFFAGDSTANLGYRVAEHVAGHGVATANAMALCRLAATRHGLRKLRAAVSHDNAASRKVLAKAGFVPVGAAGPADLGGKTGTWYERDLADLTTG